MWKEHQMIQELSSQHMKANTTMTCLSETLIQSPLTHPHDIIDTIVTAAAATTTTTTFFSNTTTQALLLLLFITYQSPNSDF